MNNINSFTFYYDYYNLVDTLPLKDKSILLVAILDYVFKDIEPKLEGHNQAIFNTLKAQLNVSKNKSKNAKKNTNQESIENKSNENQMKIKSKSNENQNEIKKDNKTSILNFKFYINNFNYFRDRGLLRGKIEEWLDYKWERKEYYKERGFNSLLTEIQNNVEKYGEQNVIELINSCMANNYKGIIFERLIGKKKIEEPRQEIFSGKPKEQDTEKLGELEKILKEFE